MRTLNGVARPTDKDLDERRTTGEMAAAVAADNVTGEIGETLGTHMPPGAVIKGNDFKEEDHRGQTANYAAVPPEDWAERAIDQLPVVPSNPVSQIREQIASGNFVAVDRLISDAKRMLGEGATIDASSPVGAGELEIDMDLGDLGTGEIIDAASPGGADELEIDMDLGDLGTGETIDAASPGGADELEIDIDLENLGTGETIDIDLEDLGTGETIDTAFSSGRDPKTDNVLDIQLIPLNRNLDIAMQDAAARASGDNTQPINVAHLLMNRPKTAKLITSAATEDPTSDSQVSVSHIIIDIHLPSQISEHKKKLKAYIEKTHNLLKSIKKNHRKFFKETIPDHPLVIQLNKYYKWIADSEAKITHLEKLQHDLEQLLKSKPTQQESEQLENQILDIISTETLEKHLETIKDISHPDDAQSFINKLKRLFNNVSRNNLAVADSETRSIPEMPTGDTSRPPRKFIPSNAFVAPLNFSKTPRTPRPVQKLRPISQRTSQPKPKYTVRPMKPLTRQHVPPTNTWEAPVPRDTRLDLEYIRPLSHREMLVAGLGAFATGVAIGSIFSLALTHNTLDSDNDRNEIIVDESNTTDINIPDLVASTATIDVEQAVTRPEADIAASTPSPIVNPTQSQIPPLDFPNEVTTEAQASTPSIPEITAEYTTSRHLNFSSASGVEARQVLPNLGVIEVQANPQTAGSRVRTLVVHHNGHVSHSDSSFDRGFINTAEPVTINGYIYYQVLDDNMQPTGIYVPKAYVSETLESQTNRMQSSQTEQIDSFGTYTIEGERERILRTPTEDNVIHYEINGVPSTFQPISRQQADSNKRVKEYANARFNNIFEDSDDTWALPSSTPSQALPSSRAVTQYVEKRYQEVFENHVNEWEMPTVPVNQQILVRNPERPVNQQILKRSDSQTTPPKKTSFWGKAKSAASKATKKVGRWFGRK